VHTIGPEEGTARVTATAPTIAGSPQVTFTHTVVTAIVSVYDDYFSPDSVAVPSGRTVVWVWEYGSNGMSHNVTFEDDPTEPTSSPTQDMGTLKRTFGGDPRTIRYRCTLHSTSFTEGEVGSVTVQ
jgi:plastocyanin